MEDSVAAYDEIVAMDRESVLHPFTQLKDFASGKSGDPVVMDTGKGVRIRDMAGHDYIDGFAGLYCVNIGYGRTEVAASLSFITLLSLAPFLAISLSFISAFPQFAELKAMVESSITQNLLPQAGGQAAGIFEIVKYAFVLYLSFFPTYEAIYGAVAAIPIFLLWIYCCWSTVLLGAEITASLPEAREKRRGE